jgi:hypothetical protein
MQQEPIFPYDITRKLYNESSVVIGTFLGGPLVGGYLIAQNFKALDEPSKIGKTWLIAILVFVLLLSSSFIPVLDQVPVIVYSFAYCVAAHRAVSVLQGNRIQMHQTQGGRIHSTWRAVAAGILFTLMMVALVLLAFYVADISFMGE